MPSKKSRLSYILVADDNSSTARAAANAAFKIACSQNLAIRGIYVVEEALALDTYANYHAELPVVGTTSDGRSREPRSRAELMHWFENQGKAALNWLEETGADAGVQVSTKLLAGGVSELVLRDAANARLLAIGRRGHGHQNDSDSLGHNFRKIAHHAHRPMLVGGSETPSLHRLMLGYHGLAHADEALAWASRLQHALSAEVIVLNVCEKAEYCQDAIGLDEIRTRLTQSDLDGYRFVTGQGRPAAELAATAEANDVDLIIVGRYRHQALVEWLVGSTVDELLRATTLPVLIA
jgi:nucleotide-binding universal stress UspA family protein